jgi:hypothetical protein
MINLQVTDEFAMWLVSTMTSRAESFGHDPEEVGKHAEHLSEEKLLGSVSDPHYDVKCFVEASLAIRFREQIKKALEEQQ